MKKKDNKSLLKYLKCLKQSKDILEAQVGKDILGHYVENIDYFKNTTREEDKKKIKSEEINKCMA